MPPIGIHHVQLAMPPGGEPRAIAFYQGLLGISQVTKPAHLAERGGCWFETGPVRIHLGVEEDFRPSRKAHPALLVEDVAAVRAALEEAGAEVVDDRALSGHERFYVYDPFGNRIEILQGLTETNGPLGP